MLVDERALPPSYPHPILSPLHEPGSHPTRQSILRVQRELNTNAAAVRSTHGAVGNHLFLTLHPLRYQLRNAGVALGVFAIPPMDPVYPAGATAAQISAADRLHARAWKSYELMIRTEHDLRSQLLASADEFYFDELKDDCVGHTSNTVLLLLEHISSNYGTFTEEEQETTTDLMNTPWDGGPLEVLIRQINVGAETFNLGAAGTITGRNKVALLYSLINKSGLLPEGCRFWRMKPVVEKTWLLSIVHFKAYAIDRNTQLTASSLQHANHTTHSPVQPPHEADTVISALSTFTEALASLHQTQQAQSDQLANLAAARTVPPKLTPIQELEKKLATAEAANRKLKSASSSRTPRAKTTPGYCWSHGMAYHLGTECRRRTTGHIPSATADNKQGGSTANCE